MLIAVCGSQGTGKSTLIQYLHDQPSFNINVTQRKTSRSVLSDWGVSLPEIYESKTLTKWFQDELLNRKIADECNLASSNDIWITERSFTDLFCYTIVRLGMYNEYSDWLNDYYDKCLEYNAMYDFVFFLNSGHFDITNDGVRSINPHFSNLIDNSMLQLSEEMYDNQTKFIVIDTPDIEERKTIIHNNIINKGYSNDTNPSSCD